MFFECTSHDGHFFELHFSSAQSVLSCACSLYEEAAEVAWTSVSNERFFREHLFASA